MLLDWSRQLTCRWRSTTPRAGASPKSTAYRRTSGTGRGREIALALAPARWRMLWTLEDPDKGFQGGGPPGVWPPDMSMGLAATAATAPAPINGPGPLDRIGLGGPGLLDEATGVLLLLAALFTAITLGAYPVVRRLTRRLEILQRGVVGFGRAGCRTGSMPRQAKMRSRRWRAASTRRRSASRIWCALEPFAAGQCQPSCARRWRG